MISVPEPVYSTLMNSKMQDLAVYAAKRSIDLNPTYAKIKHEVVVAAHQGHFELEIGLTAPSLATLPFSKEVISVNEQSFLIFKKEGFSLRIVNRHSDGSNMSFSLHNASAVVISWQPA